eukprot:2172325-Amphidinium_carterae.1
MPYTSTVIVDGCSIADVSFHSFCGFRCTAAGFQSGFASPAQEDSCDPKYVYERIGLFGVGRV